MIVQRRGAEAGGLRSQAVGLQWSLIGFPIGLQVGILSLWELLNLVTQPEKTVGWDLFPLLKAGGAVYTHNPIDAFLPRDPGFLGHL